MVGHISETRTPLRPFLSRIHSVQRPNLHRHDLRHDLRPALRSPRYTACRRKTTVTSDTLEPTLRSNCLPPPNMAILSDTKVPLLRDLQARSPVPMSSHSARARLHTCPLRAMSQTMATCVSQRQSITIPRPVTSTSRN